MRGGPFAERPAVLLNAGRRRAGRQLLPGARARSTTAPSELERLVLRRPSRDDSLRRGCSACGAGSCSCAGCSDRERDARRAPRRAARSSCRAADDEARSDFRAARTSCFRVTELIEAQRDLLTGRARSAPLDRLQPAQRGHAAPRRGRHDLASPITFLSGFFGAELRAAWCTHVDSSHGVRARRRCCSSSSPSASWRCLHLRCAGSRRTQAAWPPAAGASSTKAWASQQASAANASSSSSEESSAGRREAHAGAARLDHERLGRRARTARRSSPASAPRAQRPRRSRRRCARRRARRARRTRASAGRSRRAGRRARRRRTARRRSSSPGPRGVTPSIATTVRSQSQRQSSVCSSRRSQVMSSTVPRTSSSSLPSTAACTRWRSPVWKSAEPCSVIACDGTTAESRSGDCAASARAPACRARRRAGRTRPRAPAADVGTALAGIAHPAAEPHQRSTSAASLRTVARRRRCSVAHGKRDAER